jgi:hypothetical protein
MTSVKTNLGGDLRRFALEEVSCAQLLNAIREIYAIPPSAQVSVSYKDDEGDTCLVCHTIELQEAIRISSPKVLRLDVMVEEVLEEKIPTLEHKSRPGNPDEKVVAQCKILRHLQQLVADTKTHEDLVTGLTAVIEALDKPSFPSAECLLQEVLRSCPDLATHPEMLAIVNIFPITSDVVDLFLANHHAKLRSFGPMRQQLIQMLPSIIPIAATFFEKEVEVIVCNSDGKSVDLNVVDNFFKSFSQCPALATEALTGDEKSDEKSDEKKDEKSVSTPVVSSTDQGGSSEQHTFFSEKFSSEPFYSEHVDDVVVDENPLPVDGTDSFSDARSQLAAMGFDVKDPAVDSLLRLHQGQLDQVITALLS